MANSFQYSSAKNSFHTTISMLPRLWISFQSWLARPYLFVVFNFVIIIIAALSNFQQKLSDKSGSEEDKSQPEKQRRKVSQGVWLEINEMEEMRVETDKK
uniref:DUF4408 domain-containing protein n=1 Tax=Nelumbo nucifera TaxID=4432 RepID=A0A822YJ67_NELNU|nr:TPA_asm: hypothetical protein HUJ06_004874 [Nelumbo nucifera]